MQHDPTPTASAGPRVSDAYLRKWKAQRQKEVPHDLGFRMAYLEGHDGIIRLVEVGMALVDDLADSRTALAAANARIAVLEGERDGYKSLLFDYAHDHAEQIMEIAGGSQPLPPDKSWDVWCHALAITHLDIDIITGDPEYATLATASPEPGAAS